MIKFFPSLLALAISASPAISQGCGQPLPDLRVARGDKNIVEAWLADPTTRYRHFVLGSNYEAATLCARLRDGRVLRLTLPDTSVFEDRQPRLADLTGQGRDEIVVVHTRLDRGAALAVIGVVSNELRIIAETPPTGTPPICATPSWSAHRMRMRACAPSTPRKPPPCPACWPF